MYKAVQRQGSGVQMKTRESLTLMWLDERWTAKCGQGMVGGWYTIPTRESISSSTCVVSNVDIAKVWI